MLELEYVQGQLMSKVNDLIGLPVERCCKKMLLVVLRCEVECVLVCVVDSVEGGMLERQVELLAVSQIRFCLDSPGACVSSWEGAWW